MPRDRVDHFLELGIQFLILTVLTVAPLLAGAADSFEMLSPWPLLVIQGLLLLALVFWMARAWIRPGHRLLWPPISWAVLIFVIYAIVRYQFAEIEYLARLELIQVLIYGFLFFLILENNHRGEAIHRLVVLLIFLGMAISLYAVAQYLTGSNKVLGMVKPLEYAGRASGTYICPNHLAGFLEMILPVGLACILLGRSKALLNVFVGYACVAMAGGIAVSLSRGGWFSIGIALSLMAILLVAQGRHRWPAIVFLALFLAGGIYFLGKLPRAQKRIQNMVAETSIAEVRLKLWRPAVQIWRDHFWWGAGPGHFDYAFRAYRPEDVQVRPLYAHNDYLNTLADWGTAGAMTIGAVLMLLGWGFVRSWKYVQRTNDTASRQSNRFAISIGAAAGLVAILFHSLIDFNMHIPANALVAVTLMAILASYQRFVSEGYWISRRWLGVSVVTCVSLAGLIYLGREAWILGRENLCLRRADRAPAFEQKIVWLKRAHFAVPENSETTYQIAELLRLKSWEGAAGFESQAGEAMRWFERGMRLNRYDSRNYVGYGLCLDWLNCHEKANAFFARARQFDPRNYYVALHEGWHFLQAREFPQARRSLEEALHLANWIPSYPNPMARYYAAQFYLEVLNQLAPQPR